MIHIRTDAVKIKEIGKFFKKSNLLCNMPNMYINTAKLLLIMFYCKFGCFQYMHDDKKYILLVVLNLTANLNYDLHLLL